MYKAINDNNNSQLTDNNNYVYYNNGGAIEVIKTTGRENHNVYHDDDYENALLELSKIIDCGVNTLKISMIHTPYDIVKFFIYVAKNISCYRKRLESIKSLMLSAHLYFNSNNDFYKFFYFGSFNSDTMNYPQLFDKMLNVKQIDYRISCSLKYSISDENKENCYRLAPQVKQFMLKEHLEILKMLRYYKMNNDWEEQHKSATITESVKKYNMNIMLCINACFKGCSAAKDKSSLFEMLYCRIIYYCHIGRIVNELMKRSKEWETTSKQYDRIMKCVNSLLLLDMEKLTTRTRLNLIK